MPVGPGPYYVYLLADVAERRTYVGFTTNVSRRLRQHNGELAGGARATRGRGPWVIAGCWTSPRWTSADALSFEWHLKHVRTHGAAGRLAAAQELCVAPRWAALEVHYTQQPAAQ